MGAPAALSSSQRFFAAARLWLPSPMAKVISPGRALIACRTRSAAAPVTRKPLMRPPSPYRSKS